MSRQKYLQMVVTLAVLSMPFSANAADAPINAGAGTTVTVGDNYEIEMTGNGSIAVAAAQNANVTLGNDAKITVDGDSAYGVQTNGENSKIEFGDGAGIEMTGNAAVGVETSADNSHIKFGESAEIVLQGDYNYGASVWSENSSIEFGADAKITAVSNAVRVGGNDSQAIFGADAILTTSGDNAYTVHLGAASGSSITFDNGAVINSDGHASIGVFIERSGEVSFKDQAEIKVTGDFAYGVYLQNQYDGNVSKITFGDGAQIEAHGYNADGIHVEAENSTAEFGDDTVVIVSGEDSTGVSFGGAGSKGVFGNNTYIEASGEYSEGVYAGGEGSSIEFGSNASVVITGNDSYGARVYAADAVINFGDDAVISVSGEDAKALCVSADDALIKVGNNAQITAEGMNAQALLLWADGNSGKIEIGDNATITGNADTDYQSNLIQVMSENGVIEIGDDVKINYNYTGTDEVIGSALSVTDAGGKIVIGNGAVIRVDGFDGGAEIIGDGGEISFGDNLDLSIVNTSYANGLRVAGEDARLVVGDNAKIHINGSDSDGVLVGASGYDGMSAAFGKNAQIIVEGDSSNAVRVEAWDGKGAKVEFGADAQIIAKGDAVMGVSAGGENTIIDFTENVNVTIGTETVPSNNGSWGIEASSGATVNVDGLAQINIFGEDSMGLQAVSTGKIILERAIIKAVGNNTTAVLGDENGGEIYIGGNSIVEAEGEGAKALSATAGYVEMGADALISAVGKGANAVRGNYADAEIKIGESALIEAQGENAAGVYAWWGAVIDVADNAVISADGKNSRGVVAQHTNAEITLGDSTQIEVNGDGAIGLMATAQSGFEGSKINIGEDLLLAVSGNDAMGIYATMGKTVVGAKAQITVDGDNVTGVYAADQGTVTLADKVQISVEGDSAYGIYTNHSGAGASVELQGDTAILVNSDDGYALYAKSGAITSNLNGGTTVASGGKYFIEGDMKTGTDGIIDLLMEQDSIFTGKTDAGDGNISLGLTDSVWNVTGDSTVTHMINQNSVIDMTSDNQGFSTLTVDHLSGNGGKIILDIDGSVAHQSDKLIVTDTFTGNHVLSLKEINAREGDPTLGADAHGTVLASVNGGNGVFTAEDGEGTLYWQRYELDTLNNSNDLYTHWYLKSINTLNPGDKPTTTVETAVAAGALAYHTWRDSGTLLERMGDLRHNGDTAQGAWVRVQGSKIGREGKFKFENKYTMYELGYDQKMKQTDKYTRYGGVSFSYTDGSSSYRSGDGDNKNKAINFYVTQLGNKGHYLDVVAKINHMDNDFEVFDSNAKRITGDFDNTGISLSAEYGRKNSLSKNGWYIEPQAQMTIGYLGGSNYSTGDAQVEQSGISSILGRVGFNLGRDINKKTNFYVKANLLHEFSGDYEIRFSDKYGNRLKVEDDFNDTWFEYGIGIAYQASENNHFYFDIERSTGSDFKKDWQWNVGARWTF